MSFWRKPRAVGLPGIGNQPYPVQSLQGPLYPAPMAANTVRGDNSGIADTRQMVYRHFLPPGLWGGNTWTPQTLGLPLVTGIGAGVPNVAQLQLPPPPADAQTPLAMPYLVPPFGIGQSWQMPLPTQAQPLLTSDQLQTLYPDYWTYVGASPIPVPWTGAPGATPSAQNT
jgi:hypothetical protein